MITNLSPTEVTSNDATTDQITNNSQSPTNEPHVRETKFSTLQKIATILPENLVEYDVFISYNWGIKDGVAKLHERLEGAGLTVWRDKNLVSGTTSLFEQLGKKIRQSKVFLCFLTKDYLASENCRKEFNYASKLKKKIIYLMIERLTSEDIGEEMGFIMGNALYTQCYRNPESWWKDNFDEIRDAILFELTVNINTISLVKLF